MAKIPDKRGYYYYQSLIKKIIKLAKKEQIQLSAGTSFGMPTTRIYLTARKSGYTPRFLRISVGWESEAEMIQIARIIKKVLYSDKY